MDKIKALIVSTRHKKALAEAKANDGRHKEVQFLGERNARGQGLDKTLVGQFWGELSPVTPAVYEGIRRI